MNAKLAQITKDMPRWFFAAIVLRQAQDDPEPRRGVVFFKTFVMDPWQRGNS